MIKHIYTYGYAISVSNFATTEGRVFGAKEIIFELKRLVSKYNIDKVVDCRTKPYGLVNQPELKKELGPKYIWISEFGNPAYQTDLMEGYNKIKSYNTVILMCAEADYLKCHRLNVAIQLKVINPDYTIRHYPNMEGGDDCCGPIQTQLRV